MVAPKPLLSRWAGALLRLIDGLLVLAVLVGLLAGYLHPAWFWWTDLVAIALPYAGLLLVPVTLLLVWMRRWRASVLHAALILAIAVRALPLAWFVESEQPARDDLGLMTYNMSHWWTPDREARALNMRRLVEDLQPELIALQEARFQDEPGASEAKTVPHVAILLDSLGYETAMEDGLYPIRTALPVLGRVEMIGQSQFKLKRPGSSYRGARVMRTRFRWHGREAVLYNVHLRSFGQQKPWDDETFSVLKPSTWAPYARQYQQAYRDRAWEAEKIRSLIEEEELPVLLTGDLNSTPYSWVYRHLRGGMQDAFRVAGLGWGGTYHTFLPLVRIDYVFVSQEWEVVRARVPDVALSDHRPVVAYLQWREK